MDIELDIEGSDQISDFLRSKLKEIQSENASLESCLQYRRELVSRLKTKITESYLAPFVEITEIWKRTINGKYVIGIEIKNETETCLNNFTVTVDWNCSIPLTYKFYLLPSVSNSLRQSLKYTSHLNKSGQIIIILNVPFFTEQLSYTISGCLSFQENTRKCFINFPKNIELDPEDITNSAVAVDLNRIIEGNVKDLLALALSGEKHEFVVAEGQRFVQVLDNILSTVYLGSKKRYYVAYKICTMVDGAVLEIDNESNNLEVVIYSRNLETVISLLHFLHKNIVGVSFIPESLFRVHYSLDQMRRMLKEYLTDELNQLENAGSRDESGDFRFKMADLEQRTDMLVSRLNETQSG